MGLLDDDEDEDPYRGAIGEEERLWQRKLAIWLSAGFAALGVLAGRVEFGWSASLALGAALGLMFLLPSLAYTSPNVERRRNMAGLIVFFEVLIALGWLFVYLIGR